MGWPPVRSYRKNSLMMSQQKKSPNNNSEAENVCGTFVKVSMDGAPYLRKIDLRVYNNYPELLKALEDMFKFTIGKHVNILYSNNTYNCLFVIKFLRELLFLSF